MLQILLQSYESSYLIPSLSEQHFISVQKIGIISIQDLLLAVNQQLSQETDVRGRACLLDQLAQRLGLAVVKHSGLLVVVLLQSLEFLREFDLVDAVVEVLGEYVVCVCVVVED